MYMAQVECMQYAARQNLVGLFLCLFISKMMFTNQLLFLGKGGPL